MNNRIDKFWAEARLYEVTFFSEKNQMWFNRTCAVPIDFNEKDLLNWFIDNFNQISNVNMIFLGETWVQKGYLFSL